MYKIWRLKMQLKTKQIVSYNGHSLSANGSVNFNLNAQYSQLTESIQLMQMLNNDVNIKAKVSGKVLKLGVFRIKQITIDGDGESKIKFNGLNDYVEMDNLNILPLQSDEVKEFQVLYEADAEVEE